MNEEQEQGGSSLGVPVNIAGVLCYVLGWISGLVVFFVEKKSRFVRFHALQSLITFGILTAAGFLFGRIPVLGVIVRIGVGVLGAAAWVVGMMRAFQGQTYRFPVVGDIAQKQIQGD